jgi:hypothetical protein
MAIGHASSRDDELQEEDRGDHGGTTPPPHALFPTGIFPLTGGFVGVRVHNVVTLG